MAFPIGEGEVRVRINDRDLLAGLARDEAEVRSRFRSMDRMRAEPEIRADHAKFDRDIREAESRLDFFRKMKAEAKIDADKSAFDRKAKAVELKVAELKAMRAEIKVELDEKRMRDSDRMFGRMKQNLRDFQREAERAQIPGAKLFRTMGDITARVGPFTLSIRQLAIATSVLAPMLMDLVGSAGALIAVLGSATAGAAAVGGAGLAGFGLSALGVGLILKPLITNLGSAFKASKAYDDAVLKYGEHSKEAATAQDKLNQTLKGTGKDTQQAFKGIGKLREEWGKLTAGAKAPFFQTIGEGIKTARALLPTFARESTATFKTLAEGTQNWLKGLRSPEAKGVIQSLMSNFRGFLGPAMAGLGSLGTALGRIFANASRFLPGLGKGFQDWAQGIADATSDSGALTKRIDGWAHSFSQVWRFAKSAANAIKALLSPGTGAGGTMLDRMSDSLEKFSKWAEGDAGRKRLEEFFNNSVDGAAKLWNALKPIGKTFIEWAEAMRPFSEAFLEVVKQLGEFVNGIQKLAGGKQVIQALMALFVASKIWNMVKAVEALGAALLGLEARGLAAGGAMTMFTGGRGRGGAGLPMVLGGGGRGGRGGRGMFPLFGGRGGGKGSFFTGGPIVLDDGAISKDAARAGGKWKGMLGRTLSKGRLLTGAGAAVTIGSILIPGTGEDDSVNEAVDQVHKNIDRAVAARRARKSNLKLANLLDITQLQAQAVSAGNNIMRSLNDGIAKAEGRGDTRLADSLRRQQRRVGNEISKLTQTKQGAKFVMEIETKGGKEAQALFAKLANHKFGRKLLEIISRGGPQATRWLQAISKTKLGSKLMRIIEKGGPEASRLVSKLANAKIRDKVLKIIDKGGPLAITRLEKILGINLPDKNFSVKDIGTLPALGRLNTLNALHLSDKSTHVTANTAQAVGAIGSVKQMISSIPAVKNVVINVAANVAAGARKFARAGGGMMREDPMEKAMRMSMAPKVTKGGRYDHPTFLTGDHGGKGGPAEVVISPDPAVRDSNIAYWKSAARMLGIPGFHEGYGGASSPAGYDKALERLTGPRSLIERKKQHISNLEKNYEQADRRFTTSMGETEFLNEDGSRNEGAIQARMRQLSQLLTMKDTIADAWRELINAIDQAMNSVRDFIHQMRAGLAKMPDMVKRHTGEKKKTEMVPNERKKALADKLAEMQNVIPGLRDERTAAAEGLEDIGLDRDDLIATMLAVGGTKEATTPSERKLSGLEAAAALAGITPGTEDDTSSTQDLLAFHYDQIEKAKQMLADTDPNNDSLAQQMISSSAGAIPGLQDQFQQLTGKFYGGYTGAPGGGGGGTGNTGILSEGAALNNARADLYRQYGSNYSPMGGGGAGKIVNVTNNYQTQPVDPHTWTSQLQWELEAIL